MCGGIGVSDAFYCKECVMCEKDRDGCPKVTRGGGRPVDLRGLMQGPARNSQRVSSFPGTQIINLGSARTDLYYERKKYGFKKR